MAPRSTRRGATAPSSSSSPLTDPSLLIDNNQLDLLANLAAAGSNPSTTHLLPPTIYPLPQPPPPTTTPSGPPTRRRFTPKQPRRASTSSSIATAAPSSSLGGPSTLGAGIDSTMAPSFQAQTPLLGGGLSLVEEDDDERERDATRGVRGGGGGGERERESLDGFPTSGDGFGMVVGNEGLELYGGAGASAGGLELNVATTNGSRQGGGGIHVNNSGTGEFATSQQQQQQAEEQRLALQQAQIRTLHLADQDASETLLSNQKYQQEILSVMKKLSVVQTRTEELQTLVKEMHEELVVGPNMRVVAPGTHEVSLPWFKHFHSVDLPPNPDGIERDEYLNAIRQLPWTTTERTRLRKEVMAQNNRHVALQAMREGQDVHERLSLVPPEWFINSIEHIEWEKISLVISRRSASDCHIQWTQVDHPEINKGRWNKEESGKLFKIVEEKKERDWSGIAEELGTKRTAADCLRQFRRRGGQRKEWSKEEDEKLQEGVKLYGENWQAVARLVGRHSNQCINRWSKTLKPDIKRGKWSKDEDEALKLAVLACGPSWKQVAPRVKGRTDAQCRERWVNCLDPKVKDSKVWDEEEEAKIIDLREKQGKSWAEISTAFEGTRTDNHCMRRYNDILKRRDPSLVPPRNPATKKGLGKRKAGERDQEMEEREEKKGRVEENVMKPKRGVGRPRKVRVEEVEVGVPGQVEQEVEQQVVEEMVVEPGPEPEPEQEEGKRAKRKRKPAKAK